MKKLLTFLLAFVGMQVLSGFIQPNTGKPILAYRDELKGQALYNQFDYIKFIGKSSEFLQRNSVPENLNNMSNIIDDYKEKEVEYLNTALANAGETKRFDLNNLEEVAAYLHDTTITPPRGHRNSYVLNGQFKPYDDSRDVRMRVMMFVYGKCRLVLIKSMCMNLLNIPIISDYVPPVASLRAPAPAVVPTPAPETASEPKQGWGTITNSFNTTNYYGGQQDDMTNSGGYAWAQESSYVPPVYRFANNFQPMPMTMPYYGGYFPPRNSFNIELGLVFGGRGQGGGNNYPPVIHTGGGGVPSPYHTGGGGVW